MADRMDSIKESIDKASSLGEANGHTSHIEEQRTTGSERDAQVLQNLGLQQQTKRYISGLEIISFGFSICISWVGVAAVLQLALYQGGSVTVLYGIIVMFVMYAGIISTLAELASVYPTAGGQYHWTAILAPSSCARVLSYICGMVNVFSWIGILAGVVILIAEFILAIPIFYDPTFVPKTYQYFLLYQAVGIATVLISCFAMRKIMWTFSASLFLGMVVYFVIIVTCVARAPTYQSNDFVWRAWSNQTGWSNNGIVFFMGLVGPNYMYTGIDGALHLAEEAVNAATAVPRALVSCLFIGFITAFTFSVAMMYTAQDFEMILSTPTLFPIYELMSEACRSETAATIFMISFLILGIMAMIGCEQTAARLTWSFARDNALVFSKQIGHMNKRFEVPIWAFVVNGLVVAIIGFVYLGSSTAFESFIGTGIILNLLSFTFPAALIMARGRSERYLPSTRYFKMPPMLGWVANFVCVAWPIVSAIFYDWPTLYPVTSSNMNYASAVIGIMALFAVLNWFLWARKHYRGPRIEGSD